jgi:hypothetical protein
MGVDPVPAAEKGVGEPAVDEGVQLENLTATRFATSPQDGANLPSNSEKERAAEDSNAKRAGEYRHRLETFPAFPLPVDVSQI